MRLYLGFFLLYSLIVSHNVFASDQNMTSSRPMAAFGSDISKPEETIDVSPCDNNHTKACQESSRQWNSYCQPIRDCIPGDTIIPSKNNKILSYLFGNDADTGVTLSVLGWKNNRCHINFKEGTLIKSCALNRKTLGNLMQQLLNPELFESQSEFAQNLNNQCK